MTASVGKAGHERFVEDRLPDYELRDRKGSQILAYNAYPKPLAYHRSRARHKLGGGAAGGGKAARLDTPVPTPSGWSQLGDLRIGDHIFDESGKICKVTFLSTIEIPDVCYRLTFDDGESIDCCKDHRWITCTVADRQAIARCTEEFAANRRKSRPSRKLENPKLLWAQLSLVRRNKARKYSYRSVEPTTKTTQEIFDTLTVRGSRINHSVALAGPLDLPEIQLPIEPYVLGAWLGDGSKNCALLAGIDAGIWEHIASYGYVIRHYPKTPVIHNIIGLYRKLRQAGLLSNKHVPSKYLRASIRQRLELLQGLMDTDGTCDKDGGVEFCNTNRRIADAVFEIACSLGLKPTFREGLAKLNGRIIGPKYIIKFTATLPVFKLERKLARLKTVIRPTTKCRYIVKAERIDPVPMRCIKVDSPHSMFLFGRRMVPTHNTNMTIMDHLMACYSFTDPEEAKQVHTIIFRRTLPALDKTVITRFREIIPPECYKNYNEQKKVVTWHNGATTHFDSMQYEHDVYGKQGQWLKIDYDELGEFTFKQWTAISAWNRCPVSKNATKGGTSNPIGPGAGWIKSLFIDKVPYEEMDESQRKEYNPNDYEYFPFTYLDNPIYANDPQFIASLEQYPAYERDALKYGTWGVAGGYFGGAWDQESNVYEDDPEKPGYDPNVAIKPWHKRWMGGDWGFDNWATTYWGYLDDFGVVRIYRELVVRQQPPETLAQSIIDNSYGENGTIPKYERFYYSHDAFAKKSDVNTVAMRMGNKLKQAGVPFPTSAGTDKVGREQLFYQLLKNRVTIGEGFDHETGKSFPLQVPALQIARSCKRLIQNIPLAPRVADTALGREKIAEFPGMDFIDGAGHLIYARIGNPGEKPFSVKLAERLTGMPTEGPDKYIAHLTLKKEEREKGNAVFYINRRPRRR